jgi:hypothetical protein
MAKNFGVSLNLNKNELQNARIQNLAANPSSPVAGQIYYNTSTNKFRVYNGTSWDEFSAGSGDFSSNTSTSVDGELVLFNGTTGKSGRRATESGIIKLTSGVIGTSTPLGQIDGLSPSNDDIIQRKAGAWTNRTMAQLKSDLALNNVDNIQQLPLSYLDTDGTLAANSDVKVASQKAVKTYVDATLQGVKWKESVRAATTTNGTLATAYENGDTIDGVVLSTGDRILLKDQTTQTENGIYIVNASGAPTRATDADTGAEIKGMVVAVQQGTVNADTAWILTNDGTITLGSTNLTYTNFITANVPSASTTIQGKVELADQTETEAKASSSLAVTPAGLVNFAIKKTFTIGDNSTTSFALTHSLGTKDVVVAVRKASTDEQWETDVTATSTSQVTVVFAVAPTTNEFVVTVIG